MLAQWATKATGGRRAGDLSRYRVRPRNQIPHGQRPKEHNDERYEADFESMPQVQGPWSYLVQQWNEQVFTLRWQRMG